MNWWQELLNLGNRIGSGIRNIVRRTNRVFPVSPASEVQDELDQPERKPDQERGKRESQQQFSDLHLPSSLDSAAEIPTANSSTTTTPETTPLAFDLPSSLDSAAKTPTANSSTTTTPETTPLVVDPNYQYQDNDMSTLFKNLALEKEQQCREKNIVVWETAISSGISKELNKEIIKNSIKDNKERPITLLIPFQSKEHWMLVAFNIKNNGQRSLYLVDSLSEELRREDLENVRNLFTEVCQDLFGPFAKVEEVKYKNPMRQYFVPEMAVSEDLDEQQQLQAAIKASEESFVTVDCGVYVYQNAKNIIEVGLENALEPQDLNLNAETVKKRGIKLREEQAKILQENAATPVLDLPSAVQQDEKITSKTQSPLMFDGMAPSHSPESLEESNLQLPIAQKLILAKIVQPVRKSEIKTTRLMNWIDRGSQPGLLLHRNLGIMIDEVDANCGVSALSFAAMVGNAEAVEYFVTQKRSEVDINRQDNNGHTPLMHAILGGKFEVAKILIENGANINLCDKQGSLPLAYAVATRSFEMIDLLLAAHAGKDKAKIEETLNTKDQKGFTPIFYAIENNDKNVVDYLIRKGASREAKNYLDQTPHQYALAEEKTATLNSLIKGLKSASAASLAQNQSRSIS